MDIDSRFGIYLRLQRDLMEAYVAPVCDHGRIQRLTDELAIARRAVELDGVADEQSSDSTVPGVLN